MKIFCEKVSGAASNSKRKELTAMLDYISENKVDKVLVTELSRLGRDTLQVLDVINVLNEMKVSLFIQNYSIETLTVDGEINAMSQSGYENYRQSGGKVGRKVGYRKTDELLLTEYAEELRLLKKGISLRNVSKLTGTSINTLRKCKVLLN